ncbi:MAG: hypothetical protein ACI30R_07150 [Sodaliphilus sp.]
MMQLLTFNYDHIKRLLTTPLSHYGDNAITISNIFNKAGRH